MPLSFMHCHFEAEDLKLESAPAHPLGRRGTGAIPAWLAFMAIFSIMFATVTSRVGAATYGVTTPGQQTLTNRFLPYAGSGTQLIGNSPAWRDSAGVLGINNYLEGLETLTPAAAVNLNFSTWRTKRITLNQNTVFTAINIPSASTNVQTMLLEVIGDGAFTVSFANVTWQTPEITTPEAGVVTLYALRGDSGAVKGYTQAVTATGIGPLTSGYIPLANATNNVTDSLLLEPDANTIELRNTANNNANFNLISGNTNNTSNFYRIAATDSDGESDLIWLNGTKDLGWGAGTPTLRNGAFSVNVLSTNTMQLRFEINGFSGNTIFYDRGGVQNGLIANASGYTGAGTLFLSDDGTYKTSLTTLGPLTSGYIPVANATNNVTDSIAYQNGTNNIVILGHGPADATNVVLLVNTTVNQPPGHLVRFANNGIDQHLFFSDGEAIFGSSTLDGPAPDGSTSYLWDTSVTHSSNTNTHTEFLNTSSFLASINFDGSLSVGARTNYIVAAASGYTGAGTLFLSDDGTYKAAGSSALWSSSSGNLTPSPAVDVVSIESQSADNATNVALIVGSTLPWTAGHLLSARNSGTNYLTIGPTGGIIQGAHSKTLYGPSADVLSLLQINDVSQGDYHTIEGLYQVASDSSVTNAGWLDFYAKTNKAYLSLSVDGGSTYLDHYVSSNASYLRLVNATTNVFELDGVGNVTARSYSAGATNLVGAVAGKVTGAGTSVIGQVPYYTDTSGKAVSPSGALILDGSTNASVIGTLSANSLSLTNSTFLSSLTDLWNNAGTVYYAIRMIITNTASAAGSKALSLELSDGTVLASVDKAGISTFAGKITAAGGIGSTSGKLIILNPTFDVADGSSSYIYGRNSQNLKFGTQNANRWEVSYTNGMIYPSTTGNAQIWVGAGTNTTFARVGGNLKVDTTTTGNVGAGTDNLISYTIPANVLNIDGDSLEFDCGGTFAADAHLKTLTGVYGGTTFVNTTSLAFNNLAWRATGRIIRTGAATQKIGCTLTVGGTLLSGVNGTIATYNTAAETLSGTVVFKFTGSDDDGAPASNAVVQQYMNLKFTGAAN